MSVMGYAHHFPFCLKKNINDDIYMSCFVSYNI